VHVSAITGPLDPGQYDGEAWRPWGRTGLECIDRDGPERLGSLCRARDETGRIVTLIDCRRWGCIHTFDAQGLRYSCLGNLIDVPAWQTTQARVVQLVDELITVR